MGFITKRLKLGEKVVYQAQVHWVVFFPAFLFIVFSVAMLFVDISSSGPFSLGPLNVYVALFFTVVALIFFVQAIVLYFTAEHVITDRRVIFRSGLLDLSVEELNRSHVEGVTVRRGLLGVLLGCGRVEVTGSGGKELRSFMIANPFAFRDAVQQ